MKTTTGGLCVSLFSFLLGLASALPLFLLARRVLRGRAASPRRSVTSTLPSGQYDAQTLDSARLAMYSVRQSLRPRGTAAEWDVGYDLLAGQGGDGLRWTLSPSSSTANRVETRTSETTRGQALPDFSNSCHCTGKASSTPATHERTSSTARSCGEERAGNRGGCDHWPGGIGWPE